jgi:hypothetical protein
MSVRILANYEEHRDTCILCVVFLKALLTGLEITRSCTKTHRYVIASSLKSHLQVRNYGLLAIVESFKAH